MACECGKRSCKECRPAALQAWGQHRRKYHYTDEQLNALRAVYSLGNRRRIAAGLKSLSDRTGFPLYSLKREAQLHGWVTQAALRPLWTADEEAYLREWAGEKTASAIARALRRSVMAVESKCSAMGLSYAAQDGYTVADLMRVFGVTRQRAEMWMRRGLMGPVRHMTRDRVDTEAVRRFLRKHSHEYDLRLVDQLWFKSMLFAVTTEKAS